MCFSVVDFFFFCVCVCVQRSRDLFTQQTVPITQAQAQQIDSKFVVGMNLMAEWPEDGKYYSARIDEVLFGGVFLVTFDNYGNQLRLREDKLWIRDHLVTPGAGGGPNTMSKQLSFFAHGDDGPPPGAGPGIMDGGGSRPQIYGAGSQQHLLGQQRHLEVFFF